MVIPQLKQYGGSLLTAQQQQLPLISLLSFGAFAISYMYFSVKIISGTYFILVSQLILKIEDEGLNIKFCADNADSVVITFNYFKCEVGNNGPRHFVKNFKECTTDF